MKILRVINSMNPVNGGPCQGIRNSIPVQEKYGVENEVLCFDRPDASFIHHEKFQIHALGPAKGPYSYCREMKSWLKENLQRFDVVIIHGLWLYNSYGTYRVWKSFKKQNTSVPRLYLMPHGMLDPYFQTSKDRRFKAIRNWIFWKLVEGKVVNGVDGILFTCEEELKLARKTFQPYHPKRELNVGYGIDNPPTIDPSFIAQFQKKYPEFSDRPYWLFLGRIHPKKGVKELIQVYLEIRKIIKTLPDLVIVGPSIDTSYGKKLIQMSKGHPVHFPGMLCGETKWGVIYNCEAFILPSHQENFGIAVVEALACGKPVLISNKVNIWREIQAGDAGLVAEDTRVGIYWLLKQWLNMPRSRRLAFAANARRLFERKFTIDEASSKMIGFF